MDLDLGHTQLILEVAREENLSKEQTAYVLATAYLETNRTMQPVKEAYYLGSRAESYRRGLRYFPWYGRGFVQLTWKDNYDRVGKLLGKNFIADPESVMDPRTSAEILVKGMKGGWFSGKKLDDYINSEKTDFFSARKIVNVLNKARLFSDTAVQYLAELEKIEVKPVSNTTTDLIKTHQQRLAQLGYYNLRIDGVMGTGTEDAFTRFKTVHGLRERPFPGPITCGLLWDKEATPWEEVLPEGGTSNDPAILTEARKHLGVSEYSGRADNPVIMGWADDLDQWYPGDDVPWCGLFVAICAYRGAPNEAQDFNRLGARNWLQWGEAADSEDIPLGSIVVLWRSSRNSWKGHVGICTGQNSGYVRLLGGNQSNSVNEKWFSRSRVLGARVPTGSNYPVAPQASTGQLSTTEA